MNAIAIPKLSRYNESISLMIIREQEIIASYQRMLNRLFSTYLLVCRQNVCGFLISKMIFPEKSPSRFTPLSCPCPAPKKIAESEILSKKSCQAFFRGDNNSFRDPPSLPSCCHDAGWCEQAGLVHNIHTLWKAYSKFVP